MIIIYNNLRNLSYILSGLMLISSFIYIINLNLVFNENLINDSNFHQNYDPNNDIGIKLSQSSLSEYSGVGKAQNVTKFAQAYFNNNELNISNNENASIIVPDEWQASEINWVLNQIYEYDNLWINETFNDPIDSSLWSNHTAASHRDYVISDWYQNSFSNNDSIILTLKELTSGPTSWENIDSCLNFSRYLDREQIPFGFWHLNFQYKFIDYATWKDDAQKSRFKCFVRLDGIEIEIINPKIEDINNNTWENVEFSFFPEFYDFSPPGTIEFNFNISITDDINPTGNLRLFIDNFTLTLQTIAKPSQINLNIIDYEHLISTPVNDIDYGSGKIKISNNWSGEMGGKEYKFGFESNSKGTLVIFSECEVTATSHSYTRRELINLMGSEFTVKDKTAYNWTMYIPISIPGAYDNNYYFNISKPKNWNVTHVIDPYSNNRINDTIGAGFGNTTLTIPNEIVSDGVWKIIAEAPNYIKEVNIFKQINSDWQKNATFHYLDTLKINGTINKNSIIPDIDETNVTLKIYYPNETLWYQEEDFSVDFDGNYEFSVKNLTGISLVCGKYTFQVTWHDSDVSMTQIGYLSLNFQLIHKTNLTALNSYFELYAGDPLLLKVKFVDSDFNKSIPFGTILYNSTYGVFGIMTYQGSGIYFADLDTSSLELGDYYFSFNATEEYYDNWYMENMIHLRIIPQPLELEVPYEILTSMANSYFTCDANVRGLFTGALIYPVNVSTDWLNPYSVMDHGDGTFTFNFSTYNLPTQGVSEIYTILISANKTYYGATSQVITLTINPLQTIISVDFSVIYTSINDVAEVELSFREEGSGALINGATCSETWPGNSNIISQPQGFIVCLNTSNLSIDTYTAILKLEKAGFETAYKSITVVVEQRKIDINTIGFLDTLQAVIGQRIEIKFNLTEIGSNIIIENATVYYSWEFGTGFFDYVGNGTYQLSLKLPDTVKGSHKISLTISKEGDLYKTQDFSFIIVISEIQLPNYLVNILIIGIVFLVSVLGIIGVRSYVILPRKREKKSKLLAKTQRFKDAMNVNGLVMSTRDGGITIYTKSYYEFEIYKEDLLAGFIYAITSISKEFMSYEKAKKVKQEEQELKPLERIFELDFKYFSFLICDYKELRLVFILKEKPSENLKNEAVMFLKIINSQISTKLSNWDGSLEEFEKIISTSLNDYIFLHYREYFIFNQPKHINKIISTTELTTMESRIINVIKSMTSANPEFYLEEVLTTIDEKNKDLVIIGLESIIRKRIIIPSPKKSEELLSIL